MQSGEMLRCRLEKFVGVSLLLAVFRHAEVADTSTGFRMNEGRMIAATWCPRQTILLSKAELSAAMVPGFCSGDVRYVPCPCWYLKSRLWEVGEHDETLDHDEHSAENVPQSPKQAERPCHKMCD